MADPRHTTTATAIISVFLLLLLAALTGCGGGDDTPPPDTPTTRHYLGTQSPGDVWSWTLILNNAGTGSFSASNDTQGYTYAGSVVTMTNKYLKLTVTTSNEPGMTLPAEAYALEVPQTFLIVKPVGTDSDVIVAAARGDCPTAPASYNWVRLLESDWNPAQHEAYGVSTSILNGDKFDFDASRYYLTGDFISGHQDKGFTCADGKFISPNNTVTIGITPSGAFIGDGGPGISSFIGVVTPAANIDLNQVLAAGREYRGVKFEDASAADQDTQPVWARPDGGGGLKAGQYTDFVNNVEEALGPTLNFDAQNSPGVFNASLIHGDNPAIHDNMVVMVNRINGRYFIFGASIDGASLKPYNFIIMEQ